MPSFPPVLQSLPSGAYIFDKDGTLVDTEVVWVETYRRLLAPYGIVHDLDTHRRMMGTSAVDCIRLLQERHPSFAQGSDAVAALLEDRVRLFYATREEMGVRPMAGAQDFLEMCVARKIPMAVATSASRVDAERELTQLGWHGWFGAIVTADDVTRHKPAPDIFLEAANRLTMNPAACTAFEDGLNGVRSAHAAGMSVVFMRDSRFGITPPSEVALTVEGFGDLLAS